MVLFRKQSVINIMDPERAFFCSELIGKAFKEIQLLRSTFPSSAYYPQHFEEKSNLKLLKGCSLSKELVIVWEESSCECGQMGSNIEMSLKSNTTHTCIQLKK